jgi:hypothetical protein
MSQGLGNDQAEQGKNKMQEWMTRKIEEFQLVQVGVSCMCGARQEKTPFSCQHHSHRYVLTPTPCLQGGLLAAGVIAAFSWDLEHQQPHWVGPTAWYCSLMLAFSSVLPASSQSLIFKSTLSRPPRAIILNPRLVDDNFQLSGTSQPSNPSTALPAPSEQVASPLATPSSQHPFAAGYDSDSTVHATRSPPGSPDEIIRWNLLFVWQEPIMMLAYSIISFLVGLVVYATAPLYNMDHYGQTALEGPCKVVMRHPSLTTAHQASR